MDRVASTTERRQQPHLDRTVQQYDAGFARAAGHVPQRIHIHKSLEQMQHRQLFPLRVIECMLEAIVERCCQRPRPALRPFVVKHRLARAQSRYKRFDLPACAQTVAQRLADQHRDR
jgi:hypothetical protein